MEEQKRKDIYYTYIWFLQAAEIQSTYFVWYRQKRPVSNYIFYKVNIFLALNYFISIQ